MTLAQQTILLAKAVLEALKVQQQTSGSFDGVRRQCLLNVAGHCLYTEDLQQLIALAEVSTAGLTPELILAEREKHAELLRHTQASLEGVTIAAQRNAETVKTFGMAVKSLGDAMINSR